MPEYTAGRYPYDKRWEVLDAVQAALLLADRYRTPTGGVEVIVRVTPPEINDTPYADVYSTELAPDAEVVS